MNREELRWYADRIWGGEYEAVRIMGQILQFNRGDEVIRWLLKNNIKGKRVLEFFQEAEGCETKGVMLGVQGALNRIDKENFKLTLEDLK